MSKSRKMADEIRKTGYNTGFASGGMICKLGALCFYSSVVLADSFVLRIHHTPQTLGKIVRDL